MAASRLGTSGHHDLSLEERVNLLEGEDSLSDSDDDLDMVPRKKKAEVSFDDYIASIDDGIVDISSGTESGADKKRRRGERIAFDDDEDSDAAYENFKKRKVEKRKQALASTRRAKARVKNASLVGRKPKTVISLKDPERKRGEMVYGDEVDEDEALMETTLPEYLKERRGSWEKRMEKSKGKLKTTAGLQLPPGYDDIDFSDEERMEHLEERPKFPVDWLQRDYEDIELRYSLGVIPAPMAQYLRPYQVKGAEWLHELFVFQKGGILGDDMGLGKTIQVIAFLTAAFGKTGDERDAKRMRKIRRMGDDRWYPRVLIICPGSLMANWKAELDRWGWWHTYTYHGTAKEKNAALAAAEKGRLEIMITTYDSYRLNQNAINGYAGTPSSPMSATRSRSSRPRSRKR